MKRMIKKLKEVDWLVWYSTVCGLIFLASVFILWKGGVA